MNDQSTWPEVYAAGALDGYGARCREEATEWQDQTSHRVFVSGQFWERPTAAAQRDGRQSVIREAHEAGLHGAGVRGCSWCAG
jgi:hypothetical protein